MNDGEGPAWDLCWPNGYGVTVLAPADGVFVFGTGEDPHKNDGAYHVGTVLVLECGDIRFHLGHLQQLLYSIGDTVRRGQPLGNVGCTGTFLWNGQRVMGWPEAAHLHLWTERFLNGEWQRVWPSAVWR